VGGSRLLEGSEAQLDTHDIAAVTDAGRRITVAIVGD
jgi:hypothetical protein